MSHAAHVSIRVEFNSKGWSTSSPSQVFFRSAECYDWNLILKTVFVFFVFFGRLHSQTETDRTFHLSTIARQTLYHMVSQRLLSATSKAKLPKLVMVSMGIPKIHYFRFVNHQELCFCLPKMTAFCLPLLVVCLSSFLLAFYLASLLSLLLPFAASAAVGGTSNGPNGMQRHDFSASCIGK